ncbi:MAG: DUF4440 domain-containing protein [Planctomycetota bacterium]|nr:DUF4440 domain-containing protein [Planctomycetota bacterium]
MSLIPNSNVARIGAVLVLSVLSACRSTGGSGAAACPATLPSADRAAIVANDGAWLKALRAADWTAAAATYTKDAMLLPPNGPAVTGRDAIRAWFVAGPPIVSMEIEELEIEGCCDVAYLRGTYRLAVSPPGLGTIREKGKYIEIHRKQADGTWLKSHDMFSSDDPAPK